MFSLRLILHGRAVCVARKPRCGDCVLADFCPSAFRAEKVGRKVRFTPNGFFVMGGETSGETADVRWNRGRLEAVGEARLAEMP